MAAQWPLVAAALRSILPGLQGWGGVTVYDGTPASQSLPAVYAIVGHILDTTGSAGSFTSMQHPDGFQRIESGDVVNQITCQSGGAELPAMQTQAFALYDAVDAYIRANRTLGGALSPDGTSDVTVSVVPMWNQKGSAQSLNFTLTYSTVT